MIHISKDDSRIVLGTYNPVLKKSLHFSTGDEPDDAVIEDPKVYEPIVDYESLKERLNMFMGMYNEATRGAGMDLVFFKVRKRWF